MSPPFKKTKHGTGCVKVSTKMFSSCAVNMVTNTKAGESKAEDTTSVLVTKLVVPEDVCVKAVRHFLLCFAVH